MSGLDVKVWRDPWPREGPCLVRVMDGGELDPLNLICECGWETWPIHTKDGRSIVLAELVDVADAHLADMISRETAPDFTLKPHRGKA